MPNTEHGRPGTPFISGVVLDNLRARLKGAGHSTSAVAVASGVGQSTVSQFYRGQTHRLRIDTYNAMVAAADALNPADAAKEQAPAPAKAKAAPAARKQASRG